MHVERSFLNWVAEQSLVENCDRGPRRQPLASARAWEAGALTLFCVEMNDADALPIFLPFARAYVTYPRHLFTSAEDLVHCS